MKLLKKGIAICLFLAMIMAMVPQSVNACEQNPGCYGTGINVSCSNVQKISAGSHQIGEPSGNVITCYITVVYGEHRLFCSGCGILLGKENRTCSMTHSNSKYCTNRYSMCK